MNLARWIRRSPVPHFLVCGDKRVMIGDGHRRWADAVDCVLAAGGDTITAMSKDGAVLRSCQRGDVDDIPEADEPAPEYSERQRELAQLGQIIADAYAMAHDQTRQTSAEGYTLLVRFAELSFQRLAAIETAYAKLLEAHAAALEAGPANDGLDTALSSMLTRTMGGEAKPAGGNGAAKKEPTP